MVRRVPASLALIRSMRLAVRIRSCLLPNGTRPNRSLEGFVWVSTVSTESLMDARERESTMLVEPSEAAPEQSCGHGHHGKSRQVAADHGGYGGRGSWGQFTGFILEKRPGRTHPRSTGLGSERTAQNP